MAGTTTTITQLPAASNLNLVDKFPVDQNTGGSPATFYGTLAQILSLYTLPTASSGTLGGIKVGQNLAIDNNGVLSATAAALSPATTSTLGGVIVGSGLSVNGSGVISASAGSGYTLPNATTSSLGGVIVGTGLSVSAGTISINYGTSAGTATQGNDNRVVNALLTTGGSITGVVTAPTASAGTNSGQIATTLYVSQQGYLTQASLPVATSSVLGVVKPDGTTLTNSTGAISVTYGTTASTAAQGNDSRIVNAAPLASPDFTGTPTAPTASGGTNTTQLATTAFVSAAVSASVTGVSSVIGNTGAVTLAQLVTSGLAPLASPTFTGTPTVPGYATLASPTFTGVPLAPTASGATNNTQIATTAYVTAAVAASTTGVSSVIGRTGAITLANLVTDGVAPLASPTFTGTPAGPTAAGGTNTTQFATTAFVSAAVAASTTGVSSVIGNTGAVTLAQLVTGGVAPLASAALTGTPTAPTATTGTNTTQLATTAFVSAAVAASTTGVSSVIGNTGAVTLAQLVSGGVAPLASPTFTGTVTVPGYLTSSTAASTYAPLASPTFTGTPAGPTASGGTNTTQFATTAFVTSAISGFAPLASPTFTGTPAAPTATTGTNTTQVATTAFVAASVAASTTGVSSLIGMTGAITLPQLVTAGVAPLASPTFTGTPTVPGYLTTSSASSTYAPLANATVTGAWNMTGATVTAPTVTASDSSNNVATTAYVTNAIAGNDVTGSLLSGNGTPGIIYTDANGNASIINPYPTPAWNNTPVSGAHYYWTPPRAVILTGLIIAAPGYTTSGTGFTVTCNVGGSSVAGLTSIAITGTSGTLTPTASTAVNVAAGTLIDIQIVSLQGTAPSGAQASITPVATYG